MRPASVVVAALVAVAVVAGFATGSAVAGVLVGLVSAAIFVATVGLGLVFLRQTYNGIAPAWLEPVLDPRLPPLGTGTPQEWLAGRGTLGSATGSAGMKAAAVRSAWWMPHPRRIAVADVRYRVDPDPSEKDLRRATRRALKAARRALPSRGAVHVSGGLRRVPGPDVVNVRLVVRVLGDPKVAVSAAETAFARRFEEGMGGHRLVRET